MESNFDRVKAKCRSRYGVVVGVYLALVIAFFVYHIQLEGSLIERLAWGFGGFAVWNLVEYVIHRYMFHTDMPWAPWNYLTYELHLYHHGNPEDRDYVPVPLRFSLPVMAVLVGGFYFVAPSGLAFSSASIALGLSYLYFEWIHRRIHEKPAQNALEKIIYNYHLHHHFYSSNENFGLSFPFVDMIVGTARFGRKKQNPPPSA